MAQAQLELRKLTGLEVVSAVTAVHTGVTEHSTIYPTPSPTMPVLADALEEAMDAINAAVQANEAARNAAIVRRQKLDDLMTLAESLVPYVQTASGGDEAKIALAAMTVRKTPAPVGELPAPANLRARNNGEATTVVLRCNVVYGAKYYIVEAAKCASGVPVEAFKVVAQPPRAQAEITDLLAATEYQFRIRAVGAAGPGPWSNTVTKVTGA